MTESFQGDSAPTVNDEAGFYESPTFTQFRFNEKYLSQLPALQLFMQMGYAYLPPNDVLPLRQGKRSNVLLEPILRTKLQELNRITFRGQEYHFSEANIQDAIQRLKNIKYDGLLKTNEDIYDLLTLGTSLEQTIEQNTKSYSLRYIDWRDWRNNAFHVTAEFPVERTRSVHTCRPDIVAFVNGIPFIVIECKAPHIDMEEGVKQLIDYQRDDNIPKLFTYAQLLIATNRNASKYATVGTGSKFWAVWKERLIPDEEIDAAVHIPLTNPQKAALFTEPFTIARSHFEQLFDAGSRLLTDQDRTLYRLCRPDRLLELAYQFTVFDGGIRKIARYQQFLAVHRILDRITEFTDEGRRRGGVIWHTQGSGKSLTMVMVAKALALDTEIPNPRVIIVTDRTDLDRQIKGTFASCGMLPEQAKSGRHLIELVEEEQADVITTLIHKFNAALNVRDFVDPSPDVFLLVDESHRSQYGSFHPKMRQVFPNGCYIGFTGTPLMKKQKEKDTFIKFGGLIDPPYTINDAVADGAVVPLLYEGRHSETEVNQKAIDTWLERYCQALNDRQKADLKQKYSRLSKINQAEQVIAARAFDISEHYRQNWQGTGFKAQLVAPSKRAALKYKEYLDGLGYVRSEVIISPPGTTEGDEEEVDQQSEDEIETFWKQMMTRYGSEKKYNEQIINSFEHGDEPEILIVVDKLLTGFDAPPNTVMYLTRKLKEHTLLQAIARVNRLYEDVASGQEKEFGYIIDYAGVLEELEKALATYNEWQGFDAADLQGTLANMQQEIEKLPQRHAHLLKLFNPIENKHDEEAYEQYLADEERREDFYERLSLFSRTLAVALSSTTFITQTEPRIIDNYKADLRRFQKLKAAVKTRYSDVVDYRDIEPQIRKLLDTHLSSAEVTQVVAPINIFDNVAFENAVAQQKTPRSKADFIASSTKRSITERMEEDPAFYLKFSELIQQTIDDFREQRISEAEYLERARAIRNAVTHREDSDLPPELAADPDLLAFHGLVKPLIEAHADNAEAAQPIVLETAQAILAIIKDRAIVDWIDKNDIQKDMMNAIDDYIYDVLDAEHGIALTPDEMDTLIEDALHLAKNRNIQK